MELKKCSKCGEYKLLNSFHKDKTKKSGYKSQCKDCINSNVDRRERVKKYVIEHPEYYKEKHSEYRARNREKLKIQSREYRERHPEKSKEYYWKNRDKILEYSKEYHAKKREEARLSRPLRIKKTLEEKRKARQDYCKEYRKANREIENARQRRYKERHREKVKEQAKLYRESHPDRNKGYYDRLLAKLGKTRRVPLTPEEKEAKYLEQKEKIKVKAHERYINNFVSVEKTCKYCGNPFMTKYKQSKVFCSEECSNKSAHYKSKLAEKKRKGRITALDRLDTDITLPLLFKRDKGICKLCGKPCNWNDVEVRNGFAIVGRNYPSIDHVKPISKGGSHTWDNVQLAHHICNTLKSNKEDIKRAYNSSYFYKLKKGGKTWQN